jgi:hypothetical protein
MSGRIHLAVALDGAGWPPAAWREPTARPTELISAASWRSPARTADGAGLVLATIEDALSLGGRSFEPDASSYRRSYDDRATPHDPLGLPPVAAPVR